MKKRVLITDLDNTLFDWVDMWSKSFSAMLSEIESISKLTRSILVPEIRTVHQRHGTSEYAFLIEEVPSLKRLMDESKNDDLFDPAIYAYRKARKSSLKLYPNVRETLEELRKNSVKIVAYTESLAFYTGQRIRKLELDGLIDVLFSPKDHDLPKGLDVQSLRRYPSEHYEFKATEHHYTPAGAMKPNAQVLLSIISHVGADPSEVVYVGDSLSKDIAMAQQANVDNAWAEYGKAQERPEYQLLRDVTHWTDEDVQRERETRSVHVQPEITLKSYDQLLQEFNFDGRK